ncbi:YiiD C-terminal domain-containing protein [bacterium SPL81]|nr:YiiD C-terminal domain-containing protein [Acinetobacter baumannii]
MQEKKLTMKDFLKKIRTIPAISKFMINHYSPYRGAGISIETFDLDNYHIRIKMPLTRKNRNIVGTHFGGSLYSMVDPFYMLLLMHHLGHKYIVWDKSASINFLSPGRSTVYADIQLSANEIMEIKKLAENHKPVFRHYTLNIVDEAGTRIAEVEKVLYIRRKKPKATVS